MTGYDSRACHLGEGPLWHPVRQELFWFDILGRRLLSRSGKNHQEWHLAEDHSAAGWIDEQTLLLASETALWRFDIATAQKTKLIALDADNPVTRSNDARADPWGGFWIGTMGKNAEPQAGAIYRFYQGALKELVKHISISNAICFAPDRSCAYYSDTLTRQIMRQPLNAADGWPSGAAEVFIDLNATRLNPDGAVTDARGNLWVAMWGSSCVICFATDGREINRIPVPARQPTCPAFGGSDLCDLYVTSAQQGLSDDILKTAPLNGTTFVFKDVAQGIAEPQVIL
ncbi:SMP-30/gluconolactonase/LRE family protein [Sulfitobacter sp. F26204]|uniref:SMP-30/gluconolactonase/LRE family protein n=1 Tax=Sulfitobacter sp. F26204 TaxID=2996014 RepID=UPI00225E2D9E|nr:SMP-30/gluconolactonase/LRE family protein [Sulfitobacter sp. F26204]MCX7560141.1 SMP-30/gluconolactonase/LRE family protein [Sulfitobacter sp. F26204]